MLRALALVLVAAAASCPAPSTARSCNTDFDCLKAEVCVNGFCAEEASGEGEGEGAAGEGEGTASEGEGAASEGEGAAGEGEGSEGEGEGEGNAGEGEGEGEGTAGEGEGEGEGEGPACVIALDEHFSEASVTTRFVANGTGTAAIDEGALQLSTGGGGTESIQSNEAFDATSLDATVDVLAASQAPIGLVFTDATGAQSDFVFMDQLGVGSGEDNAGNITFFSGVAQDSVRKFRLHVGNGLVNFEVSTDGTTFTSEGTLPARPYLASANVALTMEGAVGSGTFFDNLRVASPTCDGVCPVLLEDDFTDGAIAEPHTSTGVVIKEAGGVLEVSTADNDAVERTGGEDFVLPLLGNAVTFDTATMPSGGGFESFASAFDNQGDELGGYLDNTAQFCAFFQPAGGSIDVSCASTSGAAAPFFVRVHYRANETAVDFSSDGVNFGSEVSVAHSVNELHSPTLFIGAGTYAPQPSNIIDLDRFDVVPDGCTP
jgi:hypothetical protein